MSAWFDVVDDDDDEDEDEADTLTGYHRYLSITLTQGWNKYFRVHTCNIYIYTCNII